VDEIRASAEASPNSPQARNVVAAVVSKPGLVERFKRRLYGDLRVRNMIECVICMEEFKDSDQVAELKCDERHYFHQKCLEDWLQRKSECPLCKRLVLQNE
jgi:hypothetical protein